MCHARRWASTWPCGGSHIMRGTLGGVCGVVPFPSFVLGAPLCRRGGFHSSFVLKCTHQMHLIKGLQYISPPALFMSGVLAYLHAGMVGEDWGWWWSWVTLWVTLVIHAPCLFGEKQNLFISTPVHLWTVPIRRRCCSPGSKCTFLVVHWVCGLQKKIKNKKVLIR